MLTVSITGFVVSFINPILLQSPFVTSIPRLSSYFTAQYSLLVNEKEIFPSFFIDILPFPTLPSISNFIESLFSSFSLDIHSLL